MSQAAAHHDEVTRAVKQANLPTLLASLYQITGDERWIVAPYLPTRAPGMDDHDSGGFSEEVQALIRSEAAQVLTEYLQSGRTPAVESPDVATIHAVAQATLGEAVPPQFAEMMQEQAPFLLRDDSAAHAHEVTRRDEVAIIGAGVSGLSLARRLRARGFSVQIFEQRSATGGCWNVNRYPGCGVDTPSHLYSFSFRPHAWSRNYGKRPEILSYIQDVASGSGLDDVIELDTQVTTATWDEDQRQWRVTTTHTPTGVTRERTYRFLVSAVGTLSNPSIPDVPGLDDFTGLSCHSASWDETTDLAGKRVAVVGTGASSMQIVPAIADEVEQLLVFQRSPQWVAPNRRYFAPLGEEFAWLVENVPFYQQWYRTRLAWIHNDRIHASLQIDPDWDSGGLSINETNHFHRQYFTAYLEEQLEGRADLVEKTLPGYPPFGKRMLIDNGWFRALRQDNVSVVSNRIDHLDADGIVTTDGVHHDVDVVIWATGFNAQRLIDTVDVNGPRGTLRDRWGDDDAHAYLGIATPGFPNFFIMYGPNTNLGHGGSYLTLAECQAHLIDDLLVQSSDRNAERVEVTEEACARYNQSVDEAHSRMIWSHRGMTTWYRNRAGRVVTNSPWQVMDFWQMTRRADLHHFDVTAARAAVTS